MKKAKKGKLTEAEKRDKIAAALLRKKSCETKALEIVTRLSEETPDREWLKEACNNLNQDYYDDIVTERSVTRLCGYSICRNPLGKVSSAKYHISLRDKKVYSTEERQKFCSGFCFKASNYLKAQLDTSPLWIREESSQKVKFLEENSSGTVNLSGKGEVIELVGRVNLPPEDDVTRHVVIVENSEDIEEISIRDSCLPRDDEADISRGKVKKSALKQPEKSAKKREVRFDAEYSGVRSAVAEVSLEKQIYQEAVNTLDSAEIHTRGTEPGAAVGERVSVVLKEWWTSRSSLLVDPAEEGEDLSEDEEEMNELAERTTSLAIAPDPQVLVDPELVKETEEYKLKFSAYLRGKEVYEEMPVQIKEKEDDDCKEPRLPLLDRHSQHLLRIRIVMDQIERETPDLLKYLTVPGHLVQEELGRLVRTFTLTADNITFKPAEWRLLALVLITAICRYKPELRELLGSDDSLRRRNVLLEQFAVDSSFCDDLVIDLLKKTDN